MLRLMIDGQQCPLEDGRVTLPNYSASKLRRADGWREGSTMQLGVCSTPETDSLFLHASDLHRNAAFNDTHHHAVLEVDSVAIYEGVATLDGIEHKQGGKIYRITIHSGGAEWADTAAVKRLCNSSVAMNFMMTLRDIEESWNLGSPVAMLPLRRDTYAEDLATGQYAPQQTWMPHDYYPFLSVSSILRSIASANGYTPRSNFLSSKLARHLMMSGGYRKLNVEAAERAMGFCAVRSTASTAMAGEDGRVYAWEPQFASNIGALVDTVNPATLDPEGNPLTEAYSNGGCFSFEEGRPIFTPKREVSVAFDMHLRYTTDFRILSSTRLQGFDRVHLSPACELTVELQNNYIDQRDDVMGGRSYRLFIFGYDADCVYKISGGGEVHSAISQVDMEFQAPRRAKLYVRRSDEADYSLYTGDWALYDLHVTGEGRREVEITVRTPFMSYTPASPMRFNDICFGGAEEGQSLTLEAGCSIRPIFSGAPGYGEIVEFGDVANVDISQMELLEAIAHMFNLRIYSHRPTRQLYIEPYDDFFAGGEVDWRDRQVDDSCIVREGVTEIFEHTKYGYLNADAVASRVAGSGGELGGWSKHIYSYGALHGEKSILNPIFHPTASLSGATSTAPSAEVLTVGDRDMLEGAESLEPRIVIYHGVQPLPAGEYWPSPSGYDGYPMAAFHSATAGETLCFEDRDECEGLHRYYDNELEAAATRVVLRCRIRLTPSDYMALFDLDGEGATLRSRFRLEIEGNSSLFNLETIEDYDPEEMVASCSFRQRLED